MNSPSNASTDRFGDPRKSALAAWLGGHIEAPFRFESAAADASFRRYFRVYCAKGTLIAMDAPPPWEDVRPFVRISGLLADAGVQAPRILAADLDLGFLLLTDLGPRTYLEVIDDSNADTLMLAAIETLVRWQTASRPGVLPPYDTALLRGELALFPDWYVARHLGVRLTTAEQATWDSIGALLIDAALGQGQVFVHRDYMPRNLMPGNPGPGVLDFQDAVFGPVTYDLASLLRDAFISFAPPQIETWARAYWTQARQARLPVATDWERFWRGLALMGAQRHLKVLGIFARLNYRDGKPRYLAETPRFLGYLHAAATSVLELTPLGELLYSLHARAAVR